MQAIFSSYDTGTMNSKILSEPNMTSQIYVRETMKFSDTPQTILSEICDCLKHYAAPICGIDEERNCFLGSCTFVESDRRHFLLTATHVWEKLKAFPHVGIALRRHPAPSLQIPTRLLKPIVVGKRATDEWGPDLMFLELADSDAGIIGACKSFWNLGKRREMKSTPLLEIEDGMWVVIGAPEKQIQQTGNHRVFGMRVSFCPADAYSMHSSFDYVDLGIDATATSALETYGGMSGSGVWRVRLLRNPSGQLVLQSNELCLEGVAFYESPITDGHRLIRCHGRKSLYGEGLAAIDASTK